MANKIDLDKQVSRLVRMVGKRAVAYILGEFEGQIEGYGRRETKRRLKHLCVAHEDDLDGG